MEVFNRQTDKYEEFEQTFLGDCFGIGLKRRNKEDKHVMFYVLGEDDGQWSVGCNSFDCYFVKDLKQQLEAADQWMKKYCIKTEWGYEFKD